MKTLEQLLTLGSYAGLGLLLSCTADTADNQSKNNDSDTEYVSGDSGTYDTGDSGSDSCVAWEQTFGGSDSDGIFSVQQTTDGDYVLAGFMESSVVYDDGWLVKTGADGNKEWEQTFGGSYTDVFYSVQQTTDRGYVLAGLTGSSEVGNYDGWLIKTDVDGNKEWEQTLGGSDDDDIESVQQTTDGGYVLAGYTNSSEMMYGWLVKTDADGNKQWEQTFGGSDDDIMGDYIHSVQQTTDGGYVLAGDTYSSGTGNYDGWLIKTDVDGNKEWEQTFGGSDDDNIESVQQTTDSGYILAGIITPSGAGSRDAWLIKTDADGNKQWEQTFGGSDHDYIYSVQQTTDGGYVLAGSKEFTESGAESVDGWLVKACDK